MRLTFLLAILLLASSPALAQEASKGTGPALGELLKKPAYLSAWQSLIDGKTTPKWVFDYTSSLDGPPVPSIPVPIDNQNYSLAFTCKPNECEENQFFVLFAPDGSKAWGLLGSPLTGIVWLGDPDDKTRAAITGALEN